MAGPNYTNYGGVFTPGGGVSEIDPLADYNKPAAPMEGIGERPPFVAKEAQRLTDTWAGKAPPFSNAAEAEWTERLAGAGAPGKVPPTPVASSPMSAPLPGNAWGRAGRTAGWVGAALGVGDMVANALRDSNLTMHDMEDYNAHMAAHPEAAGNRWPTAPAPAAATTSAAAPSYAEPAKRPVNAPFRGGVYNETVESKVPVTQPAAPTTAEMVDKMVNQLIGMGSRATQSMGLDAQGRQITKTGYSEDLLNQIAHLRAAHIGEIGHEKAAELAAHERQQWINERARENDMRVHEMNLKTMTLQDEHQRRTMEGLLKTHEAVEKHPETGDWVRNNDLSMLNMYKEGIGMNHPELGPAVGRAGQRFNAYMGDYLTRYNQERGAKGLAPVNALPPDWAKNAEGEYRKKLSLYYTPPQKKEPGFWERHFGIGGS